MDSTREGYLLPKPLQVLARWSPTRIMALAVALSIVLGVIDRITGPLFSFTIFYLVPVALVAWMIGPRAPVLLSLFCVIVWTIADAQPWPSSFAPVIDLWNAAVRLGFFLLVTWALATTRRALESQNKLARRVQMGLLRSGLPTDGVSESWNAVGEEFEDERILAAAQGFGWAGAEETQHRILDALDGFARGNYHDDVTTVVLMVKPNGST